MNVFIYTTLFDRKFRTPTTLTTMTGLYKATHLFKATNTVDNGVPVMLSANFPARQRQRICILISFPASTSNCYGTKTVGKKRERVKQLQ